MVDMKRLTALLLAAVLALSLVACGGDNNSSTSEENGSEDSSNSSSNTETEYKTIQLNETVTTENFDFTLTSVEFAEKSSEITSASSA